MIAWLSLVPIAITLNFVFKFLYPSSKSEADDSVDSSKSNSPFPRPDLWGTYRSNLYFGMKTKTHNSTMTGLAWNSVSDITGISKMRHTCELDDSVHFGWLKHDGRTYGKQKIVDSVHQTEMGIEFTKLWTTSDRESWAVDLSLSPTSSVKKKLSLLFYFTYDGEEQMNMARIENNKFVGFTAWTPELGHFALAAEKHKGLKAQMANFDVETDRIWTLHDIFAQKMRQGLHNAFMSVGQGLYHYTDFSSFVKLTSEAPLKESNTVAFQFFTTGEVALSFVFVPLKDTNKKAALNELANQAEALNEKKKVASDALAARLHETFSIPKYLEDFATYVLGNLLGGISYFYGDSVVQQGSAGKPERIPETGLFTDVPARPNFPRGFYWDSGFHNILIAKWDRHLSMEILKHWMNKIDENGWVGREQILGDEARSRVPREYITQNTEFSNPPAPIMPLLMITKQVAEQGNADENLLFRPQLLEIYGKLKRHYGWFLAKHCAKLHGANEAEPQPFLFRWRGRNNHHTLTSGLDDYPRGDIPSEYELHVDLLSWMALMTRSLGEMASALGIEETEYDYAQLYSEAKANLIKYHWDDSRGCFADCTVNSAADSLVFVPNTGYVSLFPMLFGLVDPDDSRLERLFDILEDSNQLWSDYGIRSLSKSDSFYGKGDQYWTGPIWINLNYLIVSSLKKYYTNNGPYAERATKIYSKLRSNLITNMSKQYQTTGYIWEQYNDRTGKGQRSRPFAGWSALIVLIISESYH